MKSISYCLFFFWFLASLPATAEKSFRVGIFDRSRVARVLKPSAEAAARYGQAVAIAHTQRQSLPVVLHLVPDDILSLSKEPLPSVWLKLAQEVQDSIQDRARLSSYFNMMLIADATCEREKWEPVINAATQAAAEAKVDYVFTKESVLFQSDKLAQIDLTNRILELLEK